MEDSRRSAGKLANVANSWPAWEAMRSAVYRVNEASPCSLGQLALVGNGCYGKEGEWRDAFLRSSLNI